MKILKTNKEEIRFEKNNQLEFPRIYPSNQTFKDFRCRIITRVKLKYKGTKNTHQILNKIKLMQSN